MDSLLANDKIRLLVTSMCNLSCDYCHNEGQEKGNTFMSIDFVKWLVDIMASTRTRVHSLTISGGEPLLHPEILEIIRLSKTFSDRISIVTNGILATDSIIDNIASEGISIFRIGVDSLNSKRPRPFNGILPVDYDLDHVVKYAKSSGMKVELNCVLTHFNIDEIGGIGKFALENGISVKFFEQVTVKTFGNGQNSGKLQAEPEISFEEFSDKLSTGVNQLLTFSTCGSSKNAADFLTGDLEAIVYDETGNDQVEFRYCNYLCQNNSCWVTGSRIDSAGFVYNCMANRGLDQLQMTRSYEEAYEVLKKSTERTCRSKSETAGC